MTTVLVHGVPETPALRDALRRLLPGDSVTLRRPGFGTACSQRRMVWTLPVNERAVSSVCRTVALVTPAVNRAVRCWES